MSVFIFIKKIWFIPVIAVAFLHFFQSYALTIAVTVLLTALVMIVCFKKFLALAFLQNKAFLCKTILLILALNFLMIVLYEQFFSKTFA